MLICTTHLTRKKAAFAVILVGAVIIGLILFLGKSPAPKDSASPLLTTNEARVSYIAELGWNVEEEPVETLQFLLPPKLSGDYVSYNELQKKQGFDLESCCGKQVTRYTYAVNNYPSRPDGVQLNLYICEDLVVAGDVFCAGNDGFQAPLAFPEGESTDAKS